MAAPKRKAGNQYGSRVPVYPEKGDATPGFDEMKNRMKSKNKTMAPVGRENETPISATQGVVPQRYKTGNPTKTKGNPDPTAMKPRNRTKVRKNPK